MLSGRVRAAITGSGIVLELSARGHWVYSVTKRSTYCSEVAAYLSAVCSVPELQLSRSAAAHECAIVGEPSQSPIIEAWLQADEPVRTSISPTLALSATL